MAPVPQPKDTAEKLLADAIKSPHIQTLTKAYLQKMILLRTAEAAAAKNLPSAVAKPVNDADQEMREAKHTLFVNLMYIIENTPKLQRDIAREFANPSKEFLEDRILPKNPGRRMKAITHFVLAPYDKLANQEIKALNNKAQIMFEAIQEEQARMEAQRSKPAFIDGKPVMPKTAPLPTHHAPAR